MHQWSAIEILILVNYLVFFASGYFTQIIKILKRKSAADFDRWAFARICAGQLIFTIYGFTLGVPGYIIGSVITSILLIILIILIIYYQGKRKDKNQKVIV